ncbi:MAG: IPT/TIG domain-containing protein [Deltaproteobacteria bacterium]|nr:IPT/TIG domain-containing protein [Deltaproteobacteria bacterium]
MRTRSFVLLALLASSCTFLDEGPQPYYPGSGAPSVSGLDVTSEQGNIGGGVVVVQGSGFGADPAKVVVLFGDKNAEIRSVSDTSVEVVVPAGPVTCGPVNVTVATESGYDVAEAAYTYVSGPTYTDGDADGPSIYDQESAYLVLQNYRYTVLGESWIGLTGVDGHAEFLEFLYPRYHTPNLTQVSAGDQGRTDEWVVQVPGQVSYINGLEDLRLRVSGIDVYNAENEGRTECVDATTLEPANCDASNAISYDLAHLEMCEEAWLDPRDRSVYRAEWPVDEDFFDWHGGAITVSIPDVDFADGSHEVTITLPEQMIVYGTEGFDSVTDWTGGGNIGQFTACFDDEEDANDETDLDDIALRWEWEPNLVSIPVDGEAGPVVDVQTYVRFNLTVMTLGWIGGESYPVRATLVVPDDHAYDEETGRSSVEMPVSVLYQFPTVDLGFGGGTPGRPTYSDPTDPRWAYMFVNADRITEYRIATDREAGIGLRGDLVVAYSTGDFGLFAFDHPLEQGSCGDCLDGDGDGWIDRDDPDCDRDYRSDGSDPVEDGLTHGLFTCNDQLDNDDDGLVDSEDPDCESGDEDESNCDDGLDNDDDGWTDELDGECIEGGLELGEDSWGCTDGLDNDGDGWIDIGDPDCATGADQEVGVGTTACNDGIDNDDHGDVDARDPYCARSRYGAWTVAEAPEMSGECTNGLDDDEDGYTDENDPDCETGSFNNENRSSYSSAEPVVPQCYDGLDNDEDEAMDAADPGCWTPGGTPDGFLDDEAAAD